MKQAVVLGGTYDHIRLIEMLQRKGYRTILIDYLDNPPAKDAADEHIKESTLDKNHVLKICRRIKPDLVVAACIDQALLTMAYVCEKLGLPCHISYKTSLQLTNKYYMKQRFLETGIPTSKFFLIGKGNKRYKSCDLSFPLVVKPADANSSKGITKVWDNTELINAIDNALKFSRSEEAVVEEFKNGDELSVDVVIQNRKALVLLVTKNIKAKTNAKNFTIIQNSYPATYNTVIIRKIHKTAEKLAEIYGIKNGLFLIQFISKGNSLSVIECTARIGGGGKHHFIKKLTGFDILEHYINLLIDNPVGIRIDYKYRYASMNYIYTYPGIIKEFAGFDELIQRKIIMDWQFYKTQGMKITGHISSNDRAGGFLIMDNDMTGLKQKILTADSTLKILDSKNEDIMMHGLYKYGDY